MDKVKRNTKVVGVSILPKHQEYIDHLMEQKAYMSASDVHRRAIEFLHEKTFPDYIFNKSAADNKRREELTETQKIEAMSEEEYATDMVNGIILESTQGENKGKKFVVIHWFGNSIGAVPLVGSKDFFITKPEFAENHKAINAGNPIDQEVKVPYSSGLLKKKYGIIITDDQAIAHE